MFTLFGRAYILDLSGSYLCRPEKTVLLPFAVAISVAYVLSFPRRQFPKIFATHVAQMANMNVESKKRRDPDITRPNRAKMNNSLYTSLASNL